MRRTALITLGFVCASAAALAAGDAFEPSAREVVEITVAPQDLAECRARLAEVAALPAVHDNGTPVFFDWGQSALPAVRCVAGEA